MERWEVPALPEEGGTAREERDEEGWGTRRAEQRTARRAEEAALRRELGLESAFGFYIVDGFEEDAIEGAAVEAVRRAALPAAGSLVPAGRGGDYPCLEGRRYTGCWGLACPLKRCWTGGPTISQARALARRARVSTALYLPGAPCHGCAAVVEVDAVEAAARPLPVSASMSRPTGSPAGPARRERGASDGRNASSTNGATTVSGTHGGAIVSGARNVNGVGAHAGTGELARRAGVGQPALASRAGAIEATVPRAGAARATRSGDEGEMAGDGEAAPVNGDAAEVTGRVDCSRGLWAHPISLSAFVSKRIPMLCEAEPALCPGFAARAHAHPAVAAHLERRREQVRRQRAEQRERER